MNILCQQYGYVESNDQVKRANIMDSTLQDGRKVSLCLESISLVCVPIIIIQNTMPTNHIVKVNKIIPIPISETREGIYKDVKDCALVELEEIIGQPFGILWESVKLKEKDLMFVGRQIFLALKSAHITGYVNENIGDDHNIFVNLTTLHTTLRGFSANVRKGQELQDAIVYDLLTAAFMLWEAITRANGVCKDPTDEDNLIFQEHALFPSLFKKRTKKYPKYKNLTSILLKIFERKVTSAEKVLELFE